MKGRLWQRLLCFLLVGVGTLGLLSCGTSHGGRARTELRVICAGSLMVPFTEVAKAYEAQNPGVRILTEGHGSVQVIRYVTELGAQADLIAVADHSLIPAMMYGAKIPDSQKSYADWYIGFATNTLGLAYTPNSRYAGEITSKNWYEILARPDVRLGVPDPRFDACGYRALMALWLAGALYQDDTIMERVLGDFEYPIVVQADDRQSTILVPEVIRPRKVSVRGSSVVLLGILESGDIDYAFEYKSVAQQRGLSFLELAPEINLSSNAFESLGYDLRVKIDYQRFATLIPDFVCQEIVYGVTIPENSPHPEQAIDYLQFLLGPEGQGIFAEQHQPFLSFTIDGIEHVPDEFKGLGGD